MDEAKIKASTTNYCALKDNTSEKLFDHNKRIMICETRTNNLGEDVSMMLELMEKQHGTQKQTLDLIDEMGDTDGIIIDELNKTKEIYHKRFIKIVIAFICIIMMVATMGFATGYKINKLQDQLQQYLQQDVSAKEVDNE